jgi:hypothetical protein
MQSSFNDKVTDTYSNHHVLKDELIIVLILGSVYVFKDMLAKGL